MSENIIKSSSTDLFQFPIIATVITFELYVNRSLCKFDAMLEL